MGKKLAQPITVTKPDVAIVGGGAGGIAVVLHLVEQAKKGRVLAEIVIVEKRDVLGPGLAFSTDCHGTILNMHSDTMGIFHDNPRDYTQWRKNLEDGPFPSRLDYGQYLKERWLKALEEARALGITIAAVQAAATDIDRAGDSAFTITLDNQSTLTAHSVVLALGNFTGSANAHLIGKPGYFPNPWPTTQLQSIPPTAHVLVVGSRLSAVDAALYLSDNGHQGPITFMSRSGRLPRVQAADPVPNPRRYVLHELARQVEGRSGPDDGLLRLASALADEISTATVGDWSWMLDRDAPLEQLATDLAAAQQQRVRWQSVLSGTAPVMERYWHSLSPASQQLFMEKFNSAWMTYRHAMPVPNAQRVLRLLETAQLQVVRGDWVAWDGMFTAKTSAGVVEAAYVVEATGQECRLERINSPLLQSAVAKGLLTPHAAGGVVVDFQSLQATRGLYVMGSLTRGTHFYVSATDRVAAHASRIAQSLTREPFASPLHVAVFVSGDLVSHLMASKLVPELIRAGHVPYLFLSKKQKGAVPELAFFENELLQEHVIPYFKDTGANDAKSPTVRQLASKYGILVQQLPALSDGSFSATMGSHYIDVGLSLLSTDISSDSVLAYFSLGKTLLHLHAENLPSYRGIMSAARAMKSKESHFIYSLREMREGAPLGYIIDIRKHAIDYAKSTLACMDDVYALGIDMVMGAVGKITRGEDLGAVSPVGASEAGADRPSKEELDEYAASIVQILVDSFASTQKKDDFKSHILGVVREWSDNNYG
ncbi:pyridine nucleotide-disulfide oxidoreductase family protein [Cordyceps militaris CM01]|uniref:Pyridine nucleotide-disulfide oxidoreductase family protein n=1 Tax=Cordyceps militaris (strain CM01) TaxID=983644 RepID=G3JFL1_CORMM|nr:pyridine nucleotide-disulfide oxidoreductase family protein [Cordyceps militaris CM01]EGX93585.1 pyridine nucleotide-disulfide oxidoreductase family protein [Cordyceps militaris CM01]